MYHRHFSLGEQKSSVWPKNEKKKSEHRYLKSIIAHIHWFVLNTLALRTFRIVVVVVIVVTVVTVYACLFSIRFIFICLVNLAILLQISFDCSCDGGKNKLLPQPNSVYISNGYFGIKKHFHNYDAIFQHFYTLCMFQFLIFSSFINITMLLLVWFAHEKKQNKFDNSLDIRTSDEKDGKKTWTKDIP